MELILPIQYKAVLYIYSTHFYIHTYIYVYPCTYLYIHTRLYTYLYISIHIYMEIFFKSIKESIGRMSAVYSYLKSQQNGHRPWRFIGNIVEQQRRRRRAIIRFWQRRWSHGRRIGYFHSTPVQGIILLDFRSDFPIFFVSVVVCFQVSLKRKKDDGECRKSPTGRQNKPPGGQCGATLYNCPALPAKETPEGAVEKRFSPSPFSV